MVVETGPLPWQPAQQPHLVVVVRGQPLIPALIEVVSDKAEPFVLAGGDAWTICRSRAWLSGELAVRTIILLIRSFL